MKEIAYQTPILPLPAFPKPVVVVPSLTAQRTLPVKPVMQAFAMKVTPEQATIWLRDHNRSNRPIRPNVVRFYAMQMRRGTWDLSSQGISFGVSGRLLNGQHRLTAIIQTGLTVDMWITVNEPDANFRHIDTGLKRAPEFALGLKKDEVSVARQILQSWEFHSYYSNDQIADVAEITTPLLRSFAIGSSCRRLWSSGAVKTGAVLRLLQGRRLDYIIRTYRALTLSIYPDMSPLVQSFHKQYEGTTGRKTTTQSQEFLVRSFKAFDETHQHHTRMAVKDIAPTMDIIRDIIRENFPSVANPQEETS